MFGVRKHEAFEDLKTMLTLSTILTVFDPFLPIILLLDAFGITVGAVLE